MSLIFIQHVVHRLVSIVVVHYYCYIFLVLERKVKTTSNKRFGFVFKQMSFCKLLLLNQGFHLNVLAYFGKILITLRFFSCIRIFCIYIIFYYNFSKSMVYKSLHEVYSAVNSNVICFPPSEPDGYQHKVRPNSKKICVVSS